MRITRLAAIPLALVLAGACASSSKSSTPPTTRPGASTSVGSPVPGKVPVAKAAFLAAGNAVCTSMIAQVQALPDPGADPKKEADNTDKTATIVSAALRKLRTLHVPKGDAATVAAIYAKVDKLVVDARKLSSAIRTGDQAAGQHAEARLQADSKAANAASNAYGLTVCGS